MGDGNAQRAAPDSIGSGRGLRRRQRIDSLAQEMPDEFAVKGIDMIDEPGLDERGKPVSDVEILRPPFEFPSDSILSPGARYLAHRRTYFRISSGRRGFRRSIRQKSKKSVIFVSSETDPRCIPLEDKHSYSLEGSQCQNAIITCFLFSR
jgi:hypothetical protein